MKKSTKISLLVLFILIISIGIYFLSEFQSLEDAFKPVVITKVITNEKLNVKFYLTARSWGISGNHNEILLSTKPFEHNASKTESEGEFLFYTTELFYKKQGADSLYIYVPSSSIGNVPNSINNKVKIVIQRLRNHDEIQKYNNNYELYGLSKLSVYQ